MAGALGQGRDLFGRQALGGDVYAQLSAADRDGPLEPDESEARRDMLHHPCDTVDRMDDALGD